MANAVELETTVESIKRALARMGKVNADGADILAYAKWGRKNGFFGTRIAEEMVNDGKAN